MATVLADAVAARVVFGASLDAPWVLVTVGALLLVAGIGAALAPARSLARSRPAGMLQEG